MGLPWVRLDTQFNTNPKVLALVEDKQWRALSVYVCGLGYCGVHGTDGFIPRPALPFIHGTSREASALVSVGLWTGCPGGWNVNGWAEFQESSQETADRKKRAQAAAASRWAKAKDGAE